MVDYTKGTGSSGTLIIRDDGWTVSFLIRNTQGATFANGATWSGWINGVGVGGKYSINGAQTVLLGSWGVGTNQDVGFTMDRTGTSGLGGPTNLTVSINRATVPPAPTAPILSFNGHTSQQWQFSSRGTGGLVIREWQLHYGPNATLGGAGNKSIASSGTSNVEGLTLATDQWAWARGRNDLGWGPWSPRAGPGRTLAGAWVKVNNIWREAVAYVKTAGVWRQAIPFVKKAGVWKDAR